MYVFVTSPDLGQNETELAVNLKSFSIVNSQAITVYCETLTKGKLDESGSNCQSKANAIAISASIILF